MNLICLPITERLQPYHPTGILTLTWDTGLYHSLFGIALNILETRETEPHCAFVLVTLIHFLILSVFHFFLFWKAGQVVVDFKNEKCCTLTPVGPKNAAQHTALNYNLCAIVKNTICSLMPKIKFGKHCSWVNKTNRGEELFSQMVAKVQHF